MPHTLYHRIHTMPRSQFATILLVRSTFLDFKSTNRLPPFKVSVSVPYQIDYL